MSIMKRGIAITLCSVALIAAAGSANAGHRYKHGQQRVHAERDQSYVVVDERSEIRTPFDYFFNNPEKYRTYRNDPGEYYQGVTRR